MLISVSIAFTFQISFFPCIIGSLAEVKLQSSGSTISLGSLSIGLEDYKAFREVEIQDLILAKSILAVCLT